jgi:hypothetical protein
MTRPQDFNVGATSTSMTQESGRSIPSLATAQHNRWDTSVQYNPPLDGFGVPELSNFMEPMDTDTFMGLMHFPSAVMNEQSTLPQSANQMEGGG